MTICMQNIWPAPILLSRISSNAGTTVTALVRIPHNNQAIEPDYCVIGCSIHWSSSSHAACRHNGYSNRSHMDKMALSDESAIH